MATQQNTKTKNPSKPNELADVVVTDNESKGRRNEVNISNPDTDPVPMKLMPSEGGFPITEDTKDDQDLWRLIQKRTIRFDLYQEFIDDILRPGFIAVTSNPKKAARKAAREKTAELNAPSIADSERYMLMHGLPFTSTQAYSLLKFATERFVKASLDMNDDDFNFPAGFSSPYMKLILQKLADLRGLIFDDLSASDLLKLKQQPVLIELIWSYWHEEGYLTQTMHAIARRFQNIRNTGTFDPLANMEIDPLRPLNNILWGYIQDAQHRLTVARRTYEYDHHYGIKLIGRAIPNFNPADSRSKFIEAFHNLLYRCSVYYKEADDLTRRADGFPVLNALKEVHLLLSEGAHNQFGDLPTTAKIEMMIEQWILSQPEIKEFLGGRLMIPYDEPWMDRVDTMKTLQGWPQTSITCYHDLARFGEQILLSIRWANWTQVNDRDFAAAWSTQWRNEIQRYAHCYQSVTGVDLGMDSPQSSSSKAAIPAILILQKHHRDKLLKRG